MTRNWVGRSYRGRGGGERGWSILEPSEFELKKKKKKGKLHMGFLIYLFQMPWSLILVWFWIKIKFLLVFDKN